MKFEEAVKIILTYEGGYAFDSQDPGGETRFGISKRQYPDLDIKNLTESEAIEIYRRDYWAPIKPLLLPERLRLCVFDCAVNQGVTRAIRILQGSVGAKQDGVLGPMTIDAVRSMPEKEVLKSMCELRLIHYAKLPHFPRFGAGWCRRLIDIVIRSL